MKQNHLQFKRHCLVIIKALLIKTKVSHDLTLGANYVHKALFCSQALRERTLEEFKLSSSSSFQCCVVTPVAVVFLNLSISVLVPLMSPWHHCLYVGKNNNLETDFTQLNYIQPLNSEETF